MRFQPVHLPAENALGDGASMTFLRHLNLCPRSAFILQRWKKHDAPTVEMQRGRAMHRALELATRAMVDNGEVMIPQDLAKVILDEVFADPEYATPIEEHDRLREGVYRWAAWTAVDPSCPPLVEGLFELDVAGWRVRCRVDYAELARDGAVCIVRDYKSSPGAASLDEVARKRDDGSFVANSFQLVLYAMVLAHGVPVREEECVACDGVGSPLALDGHGHMADFACDVCGGKTVVEVREPFPVASRAQRFDLEYVYPCVEDSGGKMVRRSLSLTRLELEAFRPSLHALLSTLSYRVESGDWPAVVSDQACAICPASLMCPIPVELKNHRGTINSELECAEALEVRMREKKMSAAVTKEITAFVKEKGPVRFGGRMVAEIQSASSSVIRDKDAMFAALEETRRYGTPFEKSRYVREQVSSRLSVRALTESEINEMEGPE